MPWRPRYAGVKLDMIKTHCPACMIFSKNKRVNIKEDVNSLHADFLDHHLVLKSFKAPSHLDFFKFLTAFLYQSEVLLNTF